MTSFAIRLGTVPDTGGTYNLFIVPGDINGIHITRARLATSTDCENLHGIAWQDVVLHTAAAAKDLSAISTSPTGTIPATIPPDTPVDMGLVSNLSVPTGDILQCVFTPTGAPDAMTETVILIEGTTY